MIGATAVLSCSLVGLSYGYTAEPGVFAAHNKPTPRGKLPAAASGLNGRSNLHGQQFAALGGGGGRGGGESSLLGAAGSRASLFETTSALRGGGIAEKIPGFDAAASALAAISVPAIAWTGGPALFASVRVDLI